MMTSLSNFTALRARRAYNYLFSQHLHKYVCIKRFRHNDRSGFHNSPVRFAFFCVKRSPRTNRTREPRCDETREVCTRLLAFVEGGTYRDLAKRVGCHSETLRRYFLFGPPRVDILTNLHREGYSIDWALGGFGAMRLSDHPKPLHEVPTEQLLVELARRQTAVETQVRELQSLIDTVRGLSVVPIPAVPPESPAVEVPRRSRRAPANTAPHAHP